MKTLKHLIMGGLLLSFLIPASLSAQDQERPEFVGITTTHWNMDNTDGSPAEWMELEKEYFEKVTKKNEFIYGSSILTHYYTGDNSEALMVTMYKNWADIEKAQTRTGELVEEGWPDEDAREAYFKKRDAYYVNLHSDEIYRTMPGAKFPDTPSTEPMIIYFQKQHLAFPEDGSTKEVQALRKEFQESVIHKNPMIKAYYNLRHGWGADNREVIDIFVLESLADVEKYGEENGKLIDAHWPDEEKRKEFFKSYNKYFTGWHGDFIYQNVPELSK